MHATCKNQVDSVRPLLAHVLKVRLTARGSKGQAQLSCMLVGEAATLLLW